jgi:hypothetical protein
MASLLDTTSGYNSCNIPAGATHCSVTLKSSSFLNPSLIIYLASCKHSFCYTETVFTLRNILWSPLQDQDQNQAILRPMVSRLVRLGVVPLLELATRCSIFLVTITFFIFPCKGALSDERMVL